MNFEYARPCREMRVTLLTSPTYTGQIPYKTFAQPSLSDDSTRLAMLKHVFAQQLARLLSIYNLQMWLCVGSQGWSPREATTRTSDGATYRRLLL